MVFLPLKSSNRIAVRARHRSYAMGDMVVNITIKSSNLTVTHEKDKQRFTMDIDGKLARVNYELRDGKMFLIHSEVPYELRGKGYGKILVEETFKQLTEEGYSAKAVCSYIRAVARRSEEWNAIIE